MAPQKPFVEIRFVVLNPNHSKPAPVGAVVLYGKSSLGNSIGFLRDFCYDTQLLKDDQVDEKGSIQPSPVSSGPLLQP